MYGGHVVDGLRIAGMSSITLLCERKLPCEYPWACGGSLSGVSGVIESTLPYWLDYGVSLTSRPVQGNDVSRSLFSSSRMD
jgi:hypothetical protein